MHLETTAPARAQNSYHRLSCLVALLMLAGCGSPKHMGLSMNSMGGDEMPVVSLSSQDILNRYPSTVKVLAYVLTPNDKTLKASICSGLLISPRVVLTAGHCVCNEKKTKNKGITIIDRTTGCAETAAVQLLYYRPKQGEVKSIKDVSREWGPAHEGVVHPHEDMMIVYSDSIKEDETTIKFAKNTESSNADLAVINLRESLEKNEDYHGHAALATKQIEFRLGDEVVLVGVGPDVGGSVGQDRLYGHNNVISRKTDDTTFVVGRQIRTAKTYDGERPGTDRDLGSYLMPGDSGGPCYLKNDDPSKEEVIGIAKSYVDGDFIHSSYTNVNNYLEWLRGKIIEANAAPPN